MLKAQPTLIDWSTVNSRIEQYTSEFDYDTRSQALAHVLLDALFPLTPEEISECITDGPNDRGVDAVLIQELNDGDRIDLFQVKCGESFEKAAKHFPAVEIDKLLAFISDVLAKKDSLRKTANPILWGKVQEIWEAFDRGTPSFVVHFASNLQGLEPTQRERAEESLRRYRTFSIREHTLSSLAVLLIEAKKPSIDREIQVVDDQCFERVDGNVRGLVATVQASSLVEMIRDPRSPDEVLRSIFDENVRVYLSSRNRINSRIVRSALSDGRSEFWYLNNGITMTCKSLSYQPGVRAPLVSMTGVQIVNGGQTSHALFEASAQDPERLKDVLVLVRIYETKTPEISQRVAESTNSQTPIRSRDLRANDEIQRKLEESFSSLGYYYERKAKQHRTQPRTKRIDALAAAQCYVAYFLEMPSVAGKDRGKIFGDLYEQILNDEITAQAILVSTQIFEPIAEQKKQLQKAIRKGSEYDSEMLFLIDGAYHLLFAVGLRCLHQMGDKMDPEKAREYIGEAVMAVQRGVARESSDPAFALKRFFKSSRAKRYIDEEVRKVLG